MLQVEEICNRALDILGVQNTIGDLQEGTVEARPMLRNYMPALQELLRAAHWNFARRQFPLTLLQDATGQLSDPDLGIGTGTTGMGSFRFEYAWPIDCMKARYIPLNLIPLNTTPPVPLTTANSLIPNYYNPITPAPFLVSNDVVPNLIGAITDWNQLPDFDNAQGQGLTSQTVILTNAFQASLVYTGRIVEPNLWDPVFQQALAAVLASRTAMSIIPDKKLAVAMQNQAISIAKGVIADARVSNGNEGGPYSIDHTPDWISARGAGSYWAYSGVGTLWGSWDAIGFPDGSVF